MPRRGVIRRDRKNHSNLRPKHKHTKDYLKHYWPYMPMVILVLVGLWMVKPHVMKSSRSSVLAVATNVSNGGLLEETNEQRLANNESALTINPQLAAAAQAKAQDMVNRNYWSHNTPDGSAPWAFVLNHGYQYQKAGENLAHGFSSDSETVLGWMNSPSHRQNLLDESYTEVGFGIANSNNFNKSGPTTVIVAMYGRPISAAPVIALGSTTGSSGKTNSYNTEQANTVITNSQKMSRADLITGTNHAWITPLLTFVIGACLATYIVKHSIGIKRALRKGERFVVTHPILDAVLVGVILIGLVITKQVGVIL